MKTIKLKEGQYKAVFVEWLDSTTYRQAWLSNPEIYAETQKEDDTFYSLSYLVGQNKMSYIFASSLHFEGKDVVGFSGVFKIPKGCVTKIKRR
jgi:hypothetical protein